MKWISCMQVRVKGTHSSTKVIEEMRERERMRCGEGARQAQKFK